MAKRDTDTEKWKKQFFKRLNQSEMLFWIYINDDCDHSGVWYVDIEVASIRIKEQINLEKMIEVFNLDEERVILFHQGKKLLIKGFVTFQYGLDPSPKNRLHLAAYKTLTAHGFDWFNGVVTALERPKEAGTGSRYVLKELNPLNGEFDQLEFFNEFWGKYPAKGQLNRSASMRIFFETVVSRETASRILKSLENYTAHLKANTWKQPLKCLNWLSEWPDWENHIEPEKEETDAERDARILAKYQKCLDENLPRIRKR